MADDSVFPARFQSTSSARRTTVYKGAAPQICGISIHVLREEDDAHFGQPDNYAQLFQSTSSARRTTHGGCCHRHPRRNFNPRPPRGGRLDAGHDYRTGLYISIHVLREEDDPRSAASPPARGNFNPRPPRGGRRRFWWSCSPQNYFNPRPPRGGRPPPTDNAPPGSLYFNPRPPRGGRHITQRPRVKGRKFQSTSSARRTTNVNLDLCLNM